jgi:hypothetical protein
MQGADHAISDVHLRGRAFGGNVASLGSRRSNASGAIAANGRPASAIACRDQSGGEHSEREARCGGGGDAAHRKPPARLPAVARRRTPDDQPRIADEASTALEKAVTDQGLSVEEYSAIVEMAQNDPQVLQKIIERLQAVAK